MLERVLRHINNWFEVQTMRGEFTVTGGSLQGVELEDGQYFRILGTLFNDGLHQSGNEELRDGDFFGEVWLLAVPRAVIELADEIKEWNVSNKPSAYQSESFGGYSYTKASNADGSPMGWEGAFRKDLNAWRKL